MDNETAPSHQAEMFVGCRSLADNGPKLLKAGLLVAGGLLLGMLTATAPRASGELALAETGKAIYLHGMLDSGKPMQASRADGMRMSGAEAACINCHQRSGLGSKEGNKSIPPISGRYLFHSDTASNRDLDLPYVDGIRVDRSPYTETTLARAIRDGLDPAGKPLDYLMPHFKLDEPNMAALIAYLEQLDQRKVPGVTDTVLHFATIITPDADPVKRAGMLDVLDNFFASKNRFVRGPAPRLAANRMMMFKASRSWQLHVWELTGKPESWQAQLERHFAEEPVLAVISGVGGKTWEPIHAFCEQAELPCLFPNIETPPAAADQDFYSIYFSRGVLLEAGLIAHRIRQSASGKEKKVLTQIYRRGDSGEAGAHALEAALSHDFTLKQRILGHDAHGHDLAEAVRAAKHADILVLWLRPPDIAALGNAPAAPAQVFMSGLMGGLDAAPLPAAWRERVRLAYPFALPQERLINVDFALGWFRIRNIPVADLQIQVDTYLACSLLSETLNHMSDTFVPEYLIERLGGTLDHRILTGYYPRLALGSGQRFASKGGYIVHFTGSPGRHLAADSGWLVPDDPTQGLKPLNNAAKE